MAVEEPMEIEDNPWSDLGIVPLIRLSDFFSEVHMRSYRWNYPEITGAKFTELWSYIPIAFQDDALLSALVHWNASPARSLTICKLTGLHSVVA